MNVPSVAWFGHEFKKSDGKRFRASLKTQENYESQNLYIKNDMLVKDFVEQRIDSSDEFQFVTFILSNLYWNEKDQKSEESGWKLFKEDELRKPPVELLLDTIVKKLNTQEPRTDVEISGIFAQYPDASTEETFTDMLLGIAATNQTDLEPVTARVTTSGLSEIESTSMPVVKKTRKELFDLVNQKLRHLVDSNLMDWGQILLVVPGIIQVIIYLYFP